MLSLEYLFKWPNAERRGNDDQRKTSGQQPSSVSCFRCGLDTWKSAYAIKERRIVDETGDVAEETITSWMEKNQEFTKGFLSENIWNMDECGCFFKTLPDEGLVDQL